MVLAKKRRLSPMSRRRESHRVRRQREQTQRYPHRSGVSANHAGESEFVA